MRLRSSVRSVQWSLVVVQVLLFENARYVRIRKGTIDRKRFLSGLRGGFITTNNREYCEYVIIKGNTPLRIRIREGEGGREMKKGRIQTG